MLQMFDDNELDDLSRKASDNYELPAITNTWDDVQQQLDIYLPQKKDKRRGFIFWWFGLLVAAGLGIWWMGNGIATKQKNKLSNTATISLPKNQQQQIAEKQGKRNDIVEKLIATTTDEGNDIKQTMATTVASQKNIKSEKSIETDALPQHMSKQTKASTTNNLLIRKETDKNIVVVNKSSANNDLFKTKNEVLISKKTLSNNNVIADDSTTATKTKVENEKTTEPVTDTTVAKKTVTGKMIEAAPAVKNQNKKSASAKSSKFEFGLVLGMDFSTVKFYNIDKPGFSIGGTVGYNINNRWLVQAGYIYTQKNYTVKGSDYKPKAHYWTYYVKLDEAQATCNMWELPLNLRYNIKTTPSSKLFAAAGLSSYFMKKENYNYYYSYNGAYRERKATYDSATNYWMGIMNISAGYERSLSKNLSLAVEPFFKLPLKDVGWGNISLNSTGVYLSLKYRPSATKKASKKNNH